MSKLNESVNDEEREILSKIMENFHKTIITDLKIFGTEFPKYPLLNTSIVVSDIHKYMNINNTSILDYNGRPYTGGIIYQIFYCIKRTYSRNPHRFSDTFVTESEIQTSIIFEDEYIQYKRNLNLAKMQLTISDKVKNKLDEYLEFNSDDIFLQGDMIRIFGGAIRDIISDRKIHDVDIICGAKSARNLSHFLKINGYKYIESLTPKDLSSIYNDVRVINEPHTFLKGDKIVQVIRPSLSLDIASLDSYKDGLKYLISNVDISCCGISYTSDDGISEDYPNAVIHAQSGVFSVNKGAKMYSENRILHRIGKLEDRGWVQIKNESGLNRDLKIKNILNSEI